MNARGTFDVKVTPQPQDDAAGGPFGRLFLDKGFHGDLEAVSHGQMLAGETAVKGSGAYVALELVAGTLQGKRGSFILQHKGTMRQGSYAMDVTVVPDSGTGELAGISALRRHKGALAFFKSLNRANVYAICYRLQTAKKPETRQRRFERLLQLMKAGKKLH